MYLLVVTCKKGILLKVIIWIIISLHFQDNKLTENRNKYPIKLSPLHTWTISGDVCWFLVKTMTCIGSKYLPVKVSLLVTSARYWSVGRADISHDKPTYSCQRQKCPTAWQMIWPQYHQHFLSSNSTPYIPYILKMSRAWTRVELIP